jgi:tetratricopeptide (TPR) repeat protein
LGIELVGRYLAEDPDVALAVLWQRLQSKRTAVVALREAYPGMTATLGVVAAFELSWERLDEAGQRLAKLLSLFALAAIPWELVEACVPEWDREELALVRNRQLVNEHLLMRVETGRYQLHQLLREFFAAKLTEPERGPLQVVWAKPLVAVAKTIGDTPTVAEIQEVAVAIPHLQALAEALHTLDVFVSKEDLGRVFTSIAFFYSGQGHYAKAEPWYERCVEIMEQPFGLDHLAVAASLNNLATLYKMQSRYAKAKPLYQRSLRIKEQQLGLDNIAVAASLNNLAGLYQSQGRYAEAEPLLVRSLVICEQQVPPAHLHVATSLNNLACLYDSQDRYVEAEPLHKRSLLIREQQLGADHPDVAISLNNLAGLCQSQWRYTEAEPLLVRSLEICIAKLGLNHPNTQQVRENLAALYDNLSAQRKLQGHYDQVVDYLEKAISLRTDPRDF